MTTRSLQQQFQTGSREALDTLFKQHYKTLIKVLTFILGDEELATEVVHEAWIKMAERKTAAGYDPDRPWLPWAVTVARCLGIDRIRRAQAQRRGGNLCRVGSECLENIARDQSSPQDKLEQQEALEALQALSTRERKLLEFRFYDNFTYQELGAALKLSSSAACRAVTRAVERLRRQLDSRSAA